MSLLHEMALAFIPLFVAFDGIGVLPVFMAFTEELPFSARKRLVTEATLAAFVVGTLFMLIGNAIFALLGISPSDFRIAGGIVLVILAINDLVFSQNRRRIPEGSIGVVPIGIPLIMGPAAMTTLLILIDTHGFWMTSVSFLANLFLVWLTFRQAHVLARILGKSGSKAIAKVMALFLAAIGIRMIRVGMTDLLSHFMN